MENLSALNVKRRITEYEKKYRFIHTKAFLLTYLEIPFRTYHDWKTSKDADKREIYRIITQRARLYQMEALEKLEGLKGKSEKSSMQWAIERYYREDLAVSNENEQSANNLPINITITKDRIPNE